MEHKFVELKALKVSSKGPGTIEGYRAVFQVDEGGDLIMKGAFRDTKEEYLNSGFTAESHVWNFKDVVGFPLEAYEDSHGWFVKSQFHSTQNAQDVRTIAKERMAAGKKVGFSFGYTPLDYSFIAAKDYAAELPKYVAADRLEYNLAQAKRFPQIRLLKRIAVLEDSIVTAPMNKLAAAVAAKSHAASMDTDTLITRSLRIRSKALRTLYDSNMAKAVSRNTLWEESIRVRNSALRTLYG